MTKLQVQQYFERQNLNLECEKHVRAAHAVMVEFGMNPPALKTILNWKRG